MAESPIDEPNPSSASVATIRRKGITPEQRRLLGTPRALPQDEPLSDLAQKAEADSPPLQHEIFSDHDSKPMPEAPAPAEARSPRQRGITVVAETKASRRMEMQRAFIIIGILVFLFAIFWTGRKFDRVKGLIMSRLNANELEGGPEKFPGLTAEELVEAALAAEKQADWTGAAQRFVEAKKKNRNYKGILFRVGKSAYDRGDWNGADEALQHALKFGENIAVANHLRGLIAVRRHDLSAAERYFEAATKAEPFVSDFFYFWAETLRLNQHPRDSIRRYQQAIYRTPNASDATLCQFKIRLARIEAVEAAAVAAEVVEMRKAGPLSVDWLMTDAALQLHAGRIKEAAQLISEARSGGTGGLFLTCAGDTVFLKASETHPDIAAVVRVSPPAQ